MKLWFVQNISEIVLKYELQSGRHIPILYCNTNNTQNPPNKLDITSSKTSPRRRYKPAGLWFTHDHRCCHAENNPMKYKCNGLLTGPS